MIHIQNIQITSTNIECSIEKWIMTPALQKKDIQITINIRKNCHVNHKSYITIYYKLTSLWYCNAHLPKWLKLAILIIPDVDIYLLRVVVILWYFICCVRLIWAIFCHIYVIFKNLLGEVLTLIKWPVEVCNYKCVLNKMKKSKRNMSCTVSS